MLPVWSEKSQAGNLLKIYWSWTGCALLWKNTSTTQPLKKTTDKVSHKKTLKTYEETKNEDRKQMEIISSGIRSPNTWDIGTIRYRI